MTKVNLTLAIFSWLSTKNKKSQSHAFDFFLILKKVKVMTWLYLTFFRKKSTQMTFGTSLYVIELFLVLKFNLILEASFLLRFNSSWNVICLKKENFLGKNLSEETKVISLKDRLQGIEWMFPRLMVRYYFAVNLMFLSGEI